jgi:hypothetical protein
MNFDTLMNINGVSGVIIYLLAWWWRLRGVPASFIVFNRVLRLLGLALILSTLFLRWYLSTSLILYISILMAGFFGGLILIVRSKA